MTGRGDETRCRRGSCETVGLAVAFVALASEPCTLIEKGSNATCRGLRVGTPKYLAGLKIHATPVGGHAADRRKYAHTHAPRFVIPVAFDVRDPDRSGISRVARSVARAFVEADGSREFETTLAGPAPTLSVMGAERWGRHRPRIVDWRSGRLDPRAELSWTSVGANVGDAVWYFPHFDMPWRAAPRRSIVAIHDLIALLVPGGDDPSAAHPLPSLD
jgi:hypothetical protein